MGAASDVAPASVALWAIGSRGGRQLPLRRGSGQRPRGGSPGLLPGLTPCVQPQGSRGLPSLRVDGRHPLPAPLPQPGSPPGDGGRGPLGTAASSRDRPSPGRDQPAGCSKAPRWAGTAPTRGRGAGKGGPRLDRAAALSLQLLSRLSQTRRPGLGSPLCSGWPVPPRGLRSWGFPRHLDSPGA